MALDLNGTFYPVFTSDQRRYSDEDKSCVQRLASKLLTVKTSAEQPGMLLGKIQSGKTKTFLSAVALAFDNGLDIAVILTKGTKALTRQTLARVNADFSVFRDRDRDQLQVFDIMTVPPGLTDYELDQKLIFVAKKQTDNLEKLATLFRDVYPQLASRRVLIIDDEADYASIGFRNSRQEGPVVNTTTRQIDSLRQILNSSAFLQVTATPYSLYLQPEDLSVNGIEFRPVRPAFSELVPIHQDYIGGEYYFDSSLEPTSVASFLYEPIGTNELQILKESDRRRFRIEDCLTSDAITVLRSAICNFIVGGCIRRIQDARSGLPPKKFSFLIHTAASRTSHAWQELIVITLNEKLREAVEENPDLLKGLIRTAYEDLKNSIQVKNHYLPPLEDVVQAVFDALRAGWVMITKVNSERQVDELLDDTGQLRLRTPLNIFIGGQILDRGITVANLIGFFYGRQPQVYQQDTVLQHSRMFGFRPIEDLTVTRFYTEPQIYDAMRRMHESDVALRRTVEENPDQPVIFIQRDDRGRVVPCSPNKILMSNTTTLRPFKRILPIGFQSDYAVRTKSIVLGIDQLLDDLKPPSGFDEPIEIPLALALDLLRRIEPTLLMETEEGYNFDWEAARAALTYLATTASSPPNNGRVWCLIRRDRNLSRRVKEGSHAVYADAPDTTRTEGAVARRVAVDKPMLILIRQNGSIEQGWRGTPFYWPVIIAQQNVRTAIFAHETTP